MLASFEKTTDHLVRFECVLIGWSYRSLTLALFFSCLVQFDAALYAKKDAIQGVSESIIMGQPAEQLGTSMYEQPPTLAFLSCPLI